MGSDTCRSDGVLGVVLFGLEGADLSNADLSGAKVADELAQAASLKDAIMPDSTKHD